MATEEYLSVNELTSLSSPRETDSLVVQTPGEYGDVMLVTVADLITEVFDKIFARLQSPEFKGEPTVPSIEDMTASDQRIANTEFVQAIAEKKANAKDPEIKGQAFFSDKIPIAVDNDGETVVLATQKDITALNTTLNELGNTISALTNTLNALGAVKSVAIPASTSRITVTEAETFATKSGGFVTCRLRFDSNSSISGETELFDLPVGYRPGGTYRYMMHSWSGTDFYAMSVYTDGSVTVHSGISAGKSFIFNFTFPVPDTTEDEG